MSMVVSDESCEVIVVGYISTTPRQQMSLTYTYRRRFIATTVGETAAEKLLLIVRGKLHI